VVDFEFKAVVVQVRGHFKDGFDGASWGLPFPVAASEGYCYRPVKVS